MNEMLLLSQFIGGAVRVWLDVAFVALVLVALLFRSDRIQNWSLFQFGCGVWALSTIAPSMIVFLMKSPSPTRSTIGMTAAANDFGIMSKLLMLTGPVLFAVAFLCVVFSLMPSKTQRSTNSR